MQKRYPIILEERRGLQEMIDFGKDYVVPNAFFDIEAYNNKTSFIIIDALNNAFSECDKLLKGENHNLVALFYHHLTRILCSYLFCKYEIDLLGVNKKADLSNLVIYQKGEKTWFIDYYNVFVE